VNIEIKKENMDQEKSKQKTRTILKILLFLLCVQLFIALLRFILPPYVFLSSGAFILGLVLPFCIAGSVIIIRIGEGKNAFALIFLISLIATFVIILPGIFIFIKIDNAVWKVRSKLSIDYDEIGKINPDTVYCSNTDFSFNINPAIKSAKIIVVDLDGQCYNRSLMSKLPSERRALRAENIDFIIYFQKKNPIVDEWTDGMRRGYYSYREVILASVYDSHTKTLIGKKTFEAREVYKDNFEGKELHLTVSDKDIADWLNGVKNDQTDHAAPEDNGPPPPG
jgi:hypothetical protein